MEIEVKVADPIPLPFEIPDDWKRRALHTLVEFVADGDWIETKDQGGSAFRLIQISNIGKGQFIETGRPKWIAADTFNRLRCTALQPNDILVARMPEPIGRAWWIPELHWPAITAVDVAIIRPKPELVSPRFLAYYLNSPQCLALTASLATGSTRHRIRRADIAQYEVPLPTLSEQQAIVDQLAALDDKIELNRQMNATLEAMAQTVFKEWFVDGVNEKWDEAAIDDVATRTACGPFGSSIKTDTFVEEGVPVISGQHLWGVMMEDNSFNFLTPEHAQKLSKAKVSRGDVIFTHAGSIGQAAFIPETSRYEEYILSQRQFFMRCDLSKVTPLFMAMYFHTPEGRHKLLANTSSSGVPSIARPVTHLRSIEFTLPPIKLQQDFGRLVSPMFDRIQANKNESLTLTALRDTLLPKLMRGEVRVKQGAVANNE